VVTQDVLVEGVHFRFEWTSCRDLGYKAAAVNLSDLAAMAAEPVGLLIGLAVRVDHSVFYISRDRHDRRGWPSLGRTQPTSASRAR